MKTRRGKGKHCAYGGCHNNSGNPGMENIRFIPFPKPTTPLGKERAILWLAACKNDKTLENITKAYYVCSQHFVHPNGPTAKHPDPTPDTCSRAEPAKKMRKGGRRRKILRSPSPEDRMEETDFRKENYFENMFLNFEKYKLSEKYCDIVLRVASTNTLFRAHILILSSASTFFEELLDNPKHRDCKNLVLSLPEYIECSGLAPVLSYIYTGKISIKISTVISIFKVAWLFKMDDLLRMCRAFCKKYGVPQQDVEVASLHVLLQKDNPATPLTQAASIPPLIEKSSPVITKNSTSSTNTVVTTMYSQPLQRTVKVVMPTTRTKQSIAPNYISSPVMQPTAVPILIPNLNSAVFTSDCNVLTTPTLTPIIPAPAASIKPSKDQKVSLTKQVFDHINDMCQKNAKNGKSSRVFFIKTGKPVDDIKSLVTSSLELIRNPLKEQEQKEDSVSISVDEPNTIEKTTNSPTEKVNDDGNIENNYNSKSNCEYCTNNCNKFVDGYIVHFFQPRFLLDTNCKSASRIADLNRQAQSFARVSSAHCITLVTIDAQVTYSHPILYILHALKEKIEETNEYPILWADLLHENNCWRIVITISEQFWVLERGEVRFAFLKSFEITPEVNEKYKGISTMRTPNEHGNKKIGESEKKKTSADTPRELKCDYCLWSFSSIASKARHIYTTHRQHMLNDNGCFKYVCDECGVYKNRSLMSVYFHKYREHGWELSQLVKQFHCGLCSKVEPSLLTIKAHYERLHKSSRDYVCDKCGFAFKTASVLCSHVRNVHVKNFKNRCPFCKKCFKDKSRLCIHVRIHTGEKPFKCVDCDYSSAFRGNLKTHMLKRHNKQLPCLKPPDAYPRIQTRGRSRGKKDSKH